MLYTHELIKGVRIRIVDKFDACYSIEEAIASRAFLTRNKHYRDFFETADLIVWAEGLSQKRYATDPNYAKALIKIMKSWKLI
ncbi:MAG: hypothetical protein U1F46_10590 [Marinagarivorans sp.]